MARAVRLTMDAEPVLGCRFVKHPWRPYWERRDDLDRLHLCSVVEPQDPESELWRFIAMPLDPYEDSQVQVRIFRSGTDTLCVRLDHLAADGAGAILRRYLPAGHVVPVCTLSGATTVAITRQSGETFDSVAARTHAAMEAIKSDCPGLASAVLLELYFVPGFTPAEYAFYRIIGRAAKSGEGYLGLTNPGVIDERQMDFGDIKVADAYGVGGVAYPPGFGITSSTFRNAMTFTAGFCDTAIDRQDVEHFLDVFVRELP